MKNTRPFWILGGIILVILGVFILFRPLSFTGWVSRLAGVVLLVSGVVRWMDDKTLGKPPLRDHPLLIALLGLVLLLSPLIPVRLAGIVLGLWALFSGIVCLVSSWRLGQLTTVWHGLTLRGMIQVGLGLLLLVQPAIVSLAIGIPIGLAFIALGLWLAVQHAR